MNSSTRDQLMESFKSKEYREAFVSTNVPMTLSTQIQQMRVARGWSQKELADRMGKQQGAVSRLESPSYTGYSIKSLREVAAALDVALVVRFAPFSELAAWYASLSPSDFAVPEFKVDLEQLEESRASLARLTVMPYSKESAGVNVQNTSAELKGILVTDPSSPDSSTPQALDAEEPMEM